MKSIIQAQNRAVKIVYGKVFFLFFSFMLSALFQEGQAQDSTKSQGEPLLNAYFKIKNALVASNASVAASSAVDLVNTINTTGNQLLDEPTKAALLADATSIAGTKDIKLQREKFASLSLAVVALAKTVKLSPAPVYEQYCPMKKASWLSADKAIKNPYYGNAMLTCGSVKQTL